MKSLSQKVSLFSLLIVLFTTSLKFVIYFLSYSITAYSEAWHSLSDVLTTVVVFIAIRFSYKNNKLQSIAAIIIAIFLTYISMSIAYNSIYYKVNIVKYPLYSGLGFIIFSMFSYFLSKMQTITGEKENSIALIADGKHSRTDMLSSFLTGISLLLINQGIDLERYVSFILAIIIFKFSIELLINTYEMNKKDSNIDVLIKKIDIKKFLNKNKKIKKILIRIILLIAFVFIFKQFLYTVPTGYEAVHLRFGKIKKIAQNGLNFKLPLADKIILENTNTIKKIKIGNIAPNSFIWAKKHEMSKQIITGDNNFIVAYLMAYYNIDDLYKYYYFHKKVDKILNKIINEEIILYFSSDSFENIILNSRKNWNKNIIKKVKNRIKNINLGIKLIDINIKDLHPPKNVVNSFEKLVASNQEQKTLIISANKYKNLTISNAKISSKQQIGLQEMKKNDSVDLAIGKSTKDKEIISVFNKYKKIIKRLKYLETIGQTIIKNKKVIMDENSNFDLWINKLEKIVGSEN